MRARDWLFSLETIGIKLGLTQISSLLDALGRPERAYRAITVAGTNGKGSVTAMIERGLRAAGHRTGRYTSPHLVHIEERIAIDGRPIPADVFDRLAAQVQQAAEHLDSAPSFFEATTALALLAFRDAGVDTAVLEVGLGGRLDATNVVDAPIVAITSIAFDHQEYLGDTLTAIAREKAGVIKPGATVIIGTNPPEVLGAIGDVAADAGAMLIHALIGVHVTATATAQGTDLTLTTVKANYGQCTLRLPGRHQVDNAVIAVRVLETIAEMTPDAIRSALAEVDWPARLEWLTWRGRDVLVDGAHNPAGARALASFLQEMIGQPVPIVVGVMRDKAAVEIVTALAPAASVFIVTAASSPRAMAVNALAEICRTTGRRTIAAVDPTEALVKAADSPGPIVVGGSLYLAGEIRASVLAAT